MLTSLERFTKVGFCRRRKAISAVAQENLIHVDLRESDLWDSKRSELEGGEQSSGKFRPQ
jgi:hypothetical protein